MARTTNSDCLRIINNRYKLGIIATQRVRDLHGGEEPVVDRKHDKLTVTALREIATGKLYIDMIEREIIQSYKGTASLENVDVNNTNEAADCSLKDVDAELDDVLLEDNSEKK